MEPGQFHRLGNDGAVSVLDRFLQSQSHCPAVEHGTHREFIETPPQQPRLLQGQHGQALVR